MPLAHLHKEALDFFNNLDETAKPYAAAHGIKGDQVTGEIILHVKQMSKLATGLSLVVASVAALPFLHEKGALEQPVSIEIPFERGLNIDEEALALVPLVMKEASLRPDANIVISGHTGSRGDASANLSLSEDRASTISEMLVSLGLERDQMKAMGVGGSEPLPQGEGESDRAYQRRLSRVVVTITP